MQRLHDSEADEFATMSELGPGIEGSETTVSEFVSSTQQLVISESEYKLCGFTSEQQHADSVATQVEIGESIGSAGDRVLSRPQSRAILPS